MWGLPPGPPPNSAMPSRKKEEAIGALKANLVQRFGSSSKEIVDAEVEGRLAASGGKLSREDIDAIEHLVVSAGKERRGGGRKVHSRSAPNLKLSASDDAGAPLPPRRNGTPMPPAPNLGAAARQAPPLRLPRPASVGSLASASAASASAASASGGSRGGGRKAALGPAPGPTGAICMTPKPAGQRPPPEDRPPKPPYGVSLVGDDDAASERSRVQVRPKFAVPLRPKLKAMDHWDLIVAFDGMKHKQEDDAFYKAGKAASVAKCRARLDEGMAEANAFREQEAEDRRQERADMLAMVEENRMLKEAEHNAAEEQRAEMRKITDDMLRGIEMRKQREKDRAKREEQNMTDWLNNEKQRKQEEDRLQSEEFARKCGLAKAEMKAAMEEAKRRKREQEEFERAYVAEQQKGMDNKEAANKAAVQARMDQIEKNCSTLGAEIAGRDAKAEKELQEKIRRVQEQADRDAKADAERRKNDHNRRTRDMLNTLGDQIKVQKEQAALDKEEERKQARKFKEQYEEGVAKDQADAEARKQARAKQDDTLIKQMTDQLQVHPRNFGITKITQQTDVAYNRALFEHMHHEGFMADLSSGMLSHGQHKGKIDPFPSVGRYDGPIHPLELQEVDAQIAG